MKQSARRVLPKVAPPDSPPEERYVVVGLTLDGEEVRRITVVASKLNAAKAMFYGFSDEVDVFKMQGGKLMRHR